MNLSSIAIRRPVFTTMVAVFLMVLGFMGLARLPTERFPNVSFPVVVVNVVYPGASPGEVEELVSRPVEDAVVSLNGLDRLRSESREGVSTVILFFKLDVDPKQAAVEAQQKISQIRFRLPKEAKDPSISRFDFGSSPVLTYTLSGGGKSLAETQRFAKDIVKPALEQLDGVASVNVVGGADREIHVDLDMAKIDSLHLSPLGVLEKLRAQNLNVPAGHFEEGASEVSVRTIGEFKNVEDIRNAIVAVSPDGSNVRLSDVARVSDGVEELRTTSRVNGSPAVVFSVVKQSGGNTVAVSDAVKTKVAELQKTFPAGVTTNLIIDEAKFIRENAHEVEIAIFFGGGMAILIILIFMLDLRSTLISSVALPTSVVSTFFVMYIMGFSLNMMTLLALSLAIGLLIDDAVVVRENISKYLERGMEPRQAAERGTQEIALSVLATTLTIVAVFVPVAFMGGVVGQFFRQFGLTISAAVLMSLFVAFTLDPMLSSRFSKAHVHGQVDKWLWLKAPFLRVFEWLERTYRRALRWALAHKLAMLMIAFSSCAGSCATVPLMGFDFVNQEDRSQFVVDIEFPSGTKLEETARLTEQAEKQLLADKRITAVFATLGAQNEVNKASWRVLTLPKDQRDVHVNVLKDVARAALKSIPSAKTNVTDPPFVEGGAAPAPITVNVRAANYTELEPLARKFEAEMHKIAGMSDIKIKYNPGAPELQVNVNRERSERLGVPVAAIALSVRAAINGEEAGKLRQGKDEIPIKVRLSEQDRVDASAVRRITVQTPKGPVALGDLAQIDRGQGPSVIEREGRQKQITIEAVPNGRSLGELAGDMQKAFNAVDMGASGSWRFDGQIKDMNESNSSFGIALLLAVVFIYIVLASQFESFSHPATIMFSLPLAFVGALFALFGAGVSLAMGSIIGMILLMGLVTKNAILLVDRAIVRVRENGETPEKAIYEAGPERLRPILMTSAAMVLGMIPTATSNGEGSEFRAPMAIAVIGGVISSTFLSLLVIPVIYLLVERAKAKLGFKNQPVTTHLAAPAE
jgi:hydrophobic/amphiphilic exporter-1 (mainly G- bacteria), HAE1 family